MTNSHPTPEQLKEVADQLSNTIADEGQVVEAGWLGFSHAVMPKDASSEQVNAMRVAFYAGASHLFASMMVILDPSTKPVERDANRVALIFAELDNFQKTAQRREEPEQ